jgi:flagellar capping protein FliD
MQSNQKLLEDRISYLDEILEAKETRLYNQFYAMEEALANMQSQQSALSNLSSIAASMTT